MNADSKKRMPPEKARALATRIVDEFRPFCERIEIALGLDFIPPEKRER